MGQSGSTTLKGNIPALFYPFTKWGKEEMEQLRLRSQLELPETFALRKFEFEFLLCQGRLIDMQILYDIFDKVFDTDNNKIVDKFEVLCVICLVSSLSNSEKVQFLFDIFNFNDKGYLIESDLSLLLLSATTGIFKIDPSIPPPSLNIQKLVLKQAYEFCKVDPTKTKLRRPELVTFASEIKEVQLYLDAWRGHAGQVLLGKNEKWRDSYFLSAAVSITPTREWLQEGLPPAHFVRWRRREQIGELGCNALFTHKTTYMKNFEKKLLYSGAGCVAVGTLKQGFLADRWLLNAVAICIVRPETLYNLFSSTGQEDVGRYCVRFFEGLGWRSNFIDDRLPCTHECKPIFAHSSDEEEAWVCLLEKGLAKYFGSYGHVGVCGTRPDATFYGLRLLTGGHVLVHNMNDYEWKSSVADISAHGKNGIAFVEVTHREGSLVAFGRSQTLVMHRSTLKKSPRSAPPHGYTFPLVAITTDKMGFKYLIMRDAFGLMPNCTNLHEDEPDTVTGHCRLFSIKVESLLEYFDTMIISKLPDSLRFITDKLKLQPWKSELISNATSGPQQPAKFILDVFGKKKSKEYATYTLFGQALIRAKDVEKKRLEDIGQSSFDSIVRDAGVKATKKVDDSLSKDYVDFAATTSSSCDWMVAGSEKVRGKTRIRIVPDEATCLSIIEQKKYEQKVQKIAEIKREKAQAALKAMLHAVGGGVGDSSIVDQDKAALDAQEAAEIEAEATRSIDVVQFETIEMTMKRGKRKPRSNVKYVNQMTYATEFSVEQAWTSFEVRLWPGTYYVYADVEFGVTLNTLGALCKPLDIRDAPWVTECITSLPSTLNVNLHVSSNNGEFNIFKPNSVEAKEKYRAGEEAVYLRQINNHCSRLDSIKVPVHKWPFASETQAEVSTSSLVRMLTRLRDDAAILGAHLLVNSRKFNEIYKIKELEYFANVEKERIEAAARDEKEKLEAEARKKAALDALDA